MSIAAAVSSEGAVAPLSRLSSQEFHLEEYRVSASGEAQTHRFDWSSSSFDLGTYQDSISGVGQSGFVFPGVSQSSEVSGDGARFAMQAASHYRQSEWLGMWGSRSSASSQLAFVFTASQPIEFSLAAHALRWAPSTVDLRITDIDGQVVWRIDEGFFGEGDFSFFGVLGPGQYTLFAGVSSGGDPNGPGDSWASLSGSVDFVAIPSPGSALIALFAITARGQRVRR